MIVGYTVCRLQKCNETNIYIIFEGYLTLKVQNSGLLICIIEKLKDVDLFLKQIQSKNNCRLKLKSKMLNKTNRS